MKTNLYLRWMSLSIITVVVLANFLVIAHPVQAAGPIFVTTGADELDSTSNGKCSLREAVISANEARAVGGCTSGAAGADWIIVPANLPDGAGPSGNYYLNLGGSNEDAARSGDLDVLDTLTIQGMGPSLTIIESSGGDRVFDILSLGSKQVVLEGFTIMGGSEVSGGGIFNYASTLSLRNVHITGNHANQLGGGIINKIQLIPGGQIGSSLTIVDSMISDNSTDEDGGGIYNDGNLEISNSLVETNSAVVNGGGISNNVQSGFSVMITNTTITKNSGGNGAGIFTSGNNFTLKNSTVYDNSGTAGTVGLLLYQGRLTIKNTIIAGHAPPRANCLIPPGAVVTSNGHNLEDSNTCGLTPADLINTAAGLDPYGQYESTTWLYGLAPGSAAIDAGALADCPLTDQRGLNFTRPADGNADGKADCDIGAFELDALPAKIIHLSAIYR